MIEHSVQAQHNSKEYSLSNPDNTQNTARCINWSCALIDTQDQWADDSYTHVNLCT